MATISEFGTAAIKKQEGFVGVGTVTGTEEEVLDQFFSDKVSLVKGSNIAGSDRFDFLVMVKL